MRYTYYNRMILPSSRTLPTPLHQETCIHYFHTQEATDTCHLFVSVEMMSLIDNYITTEMMDLLLHLVGEDYRLCCLILSFALH